MKKYFATVMLILILVVPCLTTAGDYASGVKASLILKTSTTTGGYPVRYLTTEKPEITAMRVEIGPGAETGWHTHPVPVYAYVLKGDLTVEVKGGGSFHFSAGDAIVEVVNVPHNGRNLGANPVELVVFYTGERGMPNTRAQPEDD